MYHHARCNILFHFLTLNIQDFCGWIGPWIIGRDVWGIGKKTKSRDRGGEKSIKKGKEEGWKGLK